jgi:hypothetical protein
MLEKRLEVVRALQKWGKGEGPYPDWRARLAEQDDAAARLPSRYLVSRAVMSATAKLLNRPVLVEAHRELARTALALHRYRRAHGAWPERLDQLVPAYLPELPRDWFDGGALKYRPRGTRFLLYSSNENGVDDGGDPGPPEDATGPRVFTSGKDLVWPWPAEHEEVGAPAVGGDP